jgi:solute carrier family 29 (equilibrative nucleoside transporter) protein 4
MDENISRGYCCSGGRGRNPSGSPPALDWCSCVYLGMLLCGAGFLLPYNSFITAVDFYQNKYPNSTIIFDMSFTYIITAFIALLLNNVLVETFSLNVRISFGYITALVMLCLITIFDISLEMFSTGTSYFVTLVAVSLVALGCTGKTHNYCDC